MSTIDKHPNQAFAWSRAEAKELIELRAWKAEKEPTIKVSELREWCEKRIAEWEPIIKGHPIYSQRENVISELQYILEKFCGGER
jgi:hypothetical protein